MGPMALRAVVLGLALVLAGCAGQLQPLPPARPVPDLRGTWSGTWGGTPVTLVVVEQNEVAGRGGLHVGPVPVDAILRSARDQSVSGVITVARGREAVSASVDGRLGHLGGRVALVLEAATPAGTQTLVLSGVADDRLAGTGQSTFAWGPRGPVELKRRAPTR